MRNVAILSASALMVAAGVAFAGDPTTIDSVQEVPRIFNDFPGSTLNVVNNYPTSISVVETDFVDDGIGGNFANKHNFYFSNDGGATALDFDYGDGFQYSFDMTISDASVGQVEAGVGGDLFGFPFFGVLSGNGEIAAFGGVLPFHSFGAGVYSVGDTVGLRMTYRPGAGENMTPVSYMEYEYNLNGGGWISSGPVLFGNLEGGIPSAFDQFFGVGVQNNDPIGGTSDVLFENFFVVPAPGAAALFGLAGLAGVRRRR
jgi:hypothetical protein